MNLQRHDGPSFEFDLKCTRLLDNSPVSFEKENLYSSNYNERVLEIGDRI